MASSRPLCAAAAAAALTKPAPALSLETSKEVASLPSPFILRAVDILTQVGKMLLGARFYDASYEGAKYMSARRHWGSLDLACKVFQMGLLEQVKKFCTLQDAAFKKDVVDRRRLALLDEQVMYSMASISDPSFLSGLEESEILFSLFSFIAWCNISHMENLSENTKRTEQAFAKLVEVKEKMSRGDLRFEEEMLQIIANIAEWVVHEFLPEKKDVLNGGSAFIRNYSILQLRRRIAKIDADLLPEEKIEEFMKCIADFEKSVPAEYKRPASNLMTLLFENIKTKRTLENPLATEKQKRDHADLHFTDLCETLILLTNYPTIKPSGKEGVEADLEFYARDLTNEDKVQIQEYIRRKRTPCAAAGGAGSAMRTDPPREASLHQMVFSSARELCTLVGQIEMTDEIYDSLRKEFYNKFECAFPVSKGVGDAVQSISHADLLARIERIKVIFIRQTAELSRTDAATYMLYEDFFAKVIDQVDRVKRENTAVHLDKMFAKEQGFEIFVCEVLPLVLGYWDSFMKKPSSIGEVERNRRIVLKRDSINNKLREIKSKLVKNEIYISEEDLSLINNYIQEINSHMKAGYRHSYEGLYEFHPYSATNKIIELYYNGSVHRLLKRIEIFVHDTVRDTQKEILAIQELLGNTDEDFQLQVAIRIKEVPAPFFYDEGPKSRAYRDALVAAICLIGKEKEFKPYPLHLPQSGPIAQVAGVSRGAAGGSWAVSRAKKND